MTPDGGSLLYGVGQDAKKRFTVDAPFLLANVSERIDQIVQTSIAEPPTILIKMLPLEHDPTRGYVVVSIPASPRAPHMLIAAEKMRYYGRGSTGNRILAEAEVAALYARRERWEVDRDQHLREVIADAPYIAGASTPIGYMHAFTRPIGFDGTFLRRQWRDDRQGLLNEMQQAAYRRAQPMRPITPDLAQTSNWDLDGGLGIGIGSLSDPRTALKMTIGHDGEARLFCTCTDRFESPGRRPSLRGLRVRNRRQPR
jgi:hypothetical protein